MSERRPPWKNLAPALAIIAGEVERSDLSARAAIDQTSAYVRNTLDDLGVSVTDEDSVYVAITVAAFMVQMTRNAEKNNVPGVDGAVVFTMARIAQAFAAALLDYVPDEVRP